MQIIVAGVPAQEAITRDNVTLKVDAVVYYRVVDPVKAIINVQNYPYAVYQVAQTSLRSLIGQSDMDQLLSERDKVNAHLNDVIDAPTEEPWGRTGGAASLLRPHGADRRPRQARSRRRRRRRRAGASADVPAVTMPAFAVPAGLAAGRDQERAPQRGAGSRGYRLNAPREAPRRAPGGEHHACS